MGNDHSKGEKATFTPLMPVEDRDDCRELFKKQFGVNMNFLGTAMILKSKMAMKARKARAVVQERHDSEVLEGGGSPVKGGGGADGGSAFGSGAPTPSFANFEDEHATAASTTREDRIREGIVLIGQRIEHLRLDQCVMKDDGNCQFRSLAHQLRGDADKHHLEVRSKIVTFMKKHENNFNFYFETEKEWDRYLETMKKPGTWGDELTLRAASDALNLNIHVLTSEKEHYYVCYKPEYVPETPSSPQKSGSGFEGKASGDSSGGEPMDVFVAYISPIHYNSIRFDPVKSRQTSMASVTA